MISGITIDRLDDWQKVCKIAETLFKKTKQKWWVRIVFDLENDPNEYAAPLGGIGDSLPKSQRLEDFRRNAPRSDPARREIGDSLPKPRRLENKKGAIHGFFAKRRLRALCLAIRQARSPTRSRGQSP